MSTKKYKATPKNPIPAKLKKQGRSTKWLALQLDISPRTLINWFKKPLTDWKKPYLIILQEHKLI